MPPVPPRLTRNEQRERTRTALADAAAEAFVELGFSGSSVETICERAGYSRGAFYANFTTKEELFAEVLQRRAYALYASMAQRSISGELQQTPRELGEQLAAIITAPEGRWVFRLWLELLAHASRSDGFRDIAAGFWSLNRDLIAQAIAARAEHDGVTLREDARTLASASIALDIGLALQHFVDPDAVPASTYPDAFEVFYRGVTG